MTPSLYPLSAIAHQPQLVLALSLLAVCPEIGGVLIRGDRGAAKSTAARGLAALLPPLQDGRAGPFVNLPLGATEDRVVGTLDLDAALRGEARLKPGLMAQADGGLLYIDEVNLLPDHLVDVLLDVAAMGVVRVQRDSLSAEAAARFALVGSMNPEEGGLRPQFLDRFGLCVDVAAPLDAVNRAEIVRRRMSFEANPHAFTARWQSEEGRLQQRLHAARERFAAVQLPDELLTRIAELTSGAGVRSLRADLVLHRAARAFAALDGRVGVTWNDVEHVAPLVLNHRRDPRQPPPPPPPPQPPENPPPPEHPKNGDAPAPDEEIFAPSSAAPLALQNVSAGKSQPGTQAGRVVRSVPDVNAGRLHLPSTLRSALQNRALQRDGEFQLTRHDFHAPVHEESAGRRVLFVADASGSVGVSGRMGAVKGAMLGVLAGQTGRDRAALITFRGSGAELLLDWTNDTGAVEEVIRGAPTGGRTPLAHALNLAVETLRAAQNAELVLFTDGRANVPLSPGADAWTDALSAAATLARWPVTVVDTEGGHVKLGRAAQLAQVMNAQLHTLEVRS
ncbi:VWA domain-containing protein [Deinococcus cavernae]|uniref:VWA domain-containing protein n=1 Tax=Deinococcus cavernae TaxID=2320857 RepID=A0A418V7X6_9DEIO|nr:VWA domain-containing protein [Deinococcus cavernae]RJF72194.1 VWA domain-containing protein [Deinococcus cavernae]